AAPTTTAVASVTSSTAPSVSSTTDRPATTTMAAVAVEGSACPVPASVLVADVDGDGCLDALRYADGILEAAGRRWALGRAGDQVAIGDWSCRGTRTVVLLRPSTGEVFRFDGWSADPAVAVAGAAVATVLGGKAVRAADVDRDGCHEVVVERGELPPQVVRLPRSPT
ncbi:MAG: eukaryotic-like serine/threonine-protein kinase, partial [Actinomycetota bacterium]|nr:eukaryotic-like serine/threonine-protein kinase [Actinomycetota bacterium]